MTDKIDIDDIIDAIDKIHVELAQLWNAIDEVNDRIDKIEE